MDQKTGRNLYRFRVAKRIWRFSLGVSQLKMLTDYIDHQEQHHRRKGFQEEYRDFLTKYAIEYDERYVWD